MMSETVVTVDPNRNGPAQPKPASDNPIGWIRFNISYYRTIPGIIKLVQLVRNLGCYHRRFWLIDVDK